MALFHEFYYDLRIAQGRCKGRVVPEDAPQRIGFFRIFRHAHRQTHLGWEGQGGVLVTAKTVRFFAWKISRFPCGNQTNDSPLRIFTRRRWCDCPLVWLLFSATITAMCGAPRYQRICMAMYAWIFWVPWVNNLYQGSVALVKPARRRNVGTTRGPSFSAKGFHDLGAWRFNLL